MSEVTAVDSETAQTPSVEAILDLLMSILSDGLDHPEVWDEMPIFLDGYPDLPEQIAQRITQESNATTQVLLLLLQGVALGSRGELDGAFALVEDLAVKNSQSALVQGVLFRLKALRDPENPKYNLAGKICPTPFQQMDVLELSTHLCCASWLRHSAGNLTHTEWQDVWNSATAQAIRESIHDGSYRYCNKSACPKIAADSLTPAQELAKQTPLWERIVNEQITELEMGPETVNLAYDRTCNLSCPSCRTQKYAADNATRARFDEMQQNRILPLLKDARTVFITGSGDPFASKNFRRLMHQLTEEEYPELGFQIMTNGMLFTPKQWNEFPTLHGRTRLLKISIDAATGPTHELLRRGAKWPVMLENMAFAGKLAAEGLVDHYELVFTVQQDNFREMGDAVDLAKQVGATGIYFARITNWGTFSEQEFTRKAVFMSSHPEYADFVEAMQDERLADPMVLLGDLQEFVKEKRAPARVYVQ